MAGWIRLGMLSYNTVPTEAALTGSKGAPWLALIYTARCFRNCRCVCCCMCICFICLCMSYTTITPLSPSSILLPPPAIFSCSLRVRGIATREEEDGEKNMLEHEKKEIRIFLTMLNQSLTFFSTLCII